MNCRQCGAEIADGMKFCTRCGAATGQCCPRCGAKLEPGVEFCGECGASLTPPRPARFLESWRRGWSFRVRGRASRGEYWWRQLGLLIECAVLYVVLGLLVEARAFGRYEDDNIVVMLCIVCVYFVIMGIPLTCLCIRRLHDQGLSGWFVLLWNIRPVGLVFSLLPGTHGPNAYGPEPGTEKPAARPKAGGAAAGTGQPGHAGSSVRKPLVVPKPKTIHVSKPKPIVMTKSQCDAISGDAPEG